MITAEELTEQRRGRAIVSDVTFRCEPGTITGFVGPNGAGTRATRVRQLATPSWLSTRPKPVMRRRASTGPLRQSR